VQRGHCALDDRSFDSAPGLQLVFTLSFSLSATVFGHHHLRRLPIRRAQV
jgi:hypothetical protein